jgi:hypothetical protein
MLPQTLKRFFWDARLEAIDQGRNRNYVISRLLELGDDDAIQWLERAYSTDELRYAVTVSRSLSPKSRNYWKIKYHLA